MVCMQYILPHITARNETKLNVNVSQQMNYSSYSSSTAEYRKYQYRNAKKQQILQLMKHQDHKNSNRFDGASGELFASWVVFLLAAAFGDLSVVQLCREAILDQCTTSIQNIEIAPECTTQSDQQLKCWCLPFIPSLNIPYHVPISDM